MKRAGKFKLPILIVGELVYHGPWDGKDGKIGSKATIIIVE